MLGILMNITIPPPLPPLVSAAAEASSDLEPVIHFGFGWEEAGVSTNGSTELEFAGFEWVSLLNSPWDCMGEVREGKVRGGEASIHIRIGEIVGGGEEKQRKGKERGGKFLF